MKFTQKFFGLIILGAVAVGFIWPAPGLYFKPYLSYLLMLMMFLSCLKLDLKQLADVRKNWWRYSVLLIFIFIIPAALAWCFKFYLNGTVFAGLILAAAMPCAVSVVFLSDMFHGLPAQALVTTTIAHLLSPLIIPGLVWLFARQEVKIEFLSMVYTIGKLVVIPLLAAQIFRLLRRQDYLIKYVSPLNTYLLIILIWGIIAPARSLVSANIVQFLILCAIASLIMVVEYLAAAKFGRNKKEDITWVIVSSYKNFTLSSVIALSMFGPLAALGSVAYSIMNNILLIPLPWLIKKYKI